MEEKNFREKNIVYSEYYCSEAAYVKFLKKHGVTTIGQLLDSEFKDKIFNGHLMRGKTASSLRVFIGLLKFKYLQKPLLMDVYLDRVIDLEKTSFSSYGSIEFIPEEGKADSSNLYLFFGGSFGDRVFGDFVSQVRSKNTMRVIDNMPKKEVKMIDFFNWILSNENKYSYLVPYAKAYVASYTKDASLLKADSPTLQFLDNQLRILLEERNDINLQIASTRAQIDEYHSRKGGSVK